MARSWVYFIRPVGREGPVKIGVSRTPQQRLAHYLIWSPLPLEIVAMTEGGFALEARFHAKFFEQRLHHEWFAPSADLTATINAILDGGFNAADLPCGRSLARLPARDGLARAYQSAATSLAWRRRRGLPIPAEVAAASGGMWGVSDEEKTRRRGVIVDFIRSTSKAA